MKQLELKNDHFKYLQVSFKEWLDILGYSARTVKSWPIHVREFLYYLESNDIEHITQAKAGKVKDFIYYLKTRRNKTTGAGLSTNHIKKTINSINSFARYLSVTGKYELEITKLKYDKGIEEPEHFTLEEINAIYDATFTHNRQSETAIGQRDRAIIAIYYGCGLRKEEGIQLNITDIDFVKRLLLVKKGKGNKQRYVPIARKNLEDIRVYIEEGRNWFMYDHAQQNYKKQFRLKENLDTEALFLNLRGQRMREGVYSRIITLKEKAGIEKKAGLHTLRHSIATHLLQSGMGLEEIAQFLGHSSLESTQIYTHIVSKIEKDERYNELLQLPE